MKSGTLWICNYPWPVKIINGEVYHKGQRVWGITNKWCNRIDVGSADASEEKVISTVLHEFGHAIFTTVSNGYPDDEESCCQTFEVALFSALRDRRNRWFWKEVRGE